MTVHDERTHLSYLPTQLFDLVADVEHYPEFLPGVFAARVRRYEGQTVWVELTVGSQFIRKRFSSVAQLDRPHRIEITSHDSLFDQFQQRWGFEPAARGGTNVEYHLNFSFRSRLLQALIGGLFMEQASKTVTAFRHRAAQLYGPP